MKNYKILLFQAVCALVLSFSVAALADNDKTGVVTVVRVKGSASYSLDGGTTWLPVVLRKPLSPGSLIRTEDNGVVDLLIGQSVSDKNVEIFKNLPTPDKLSKNPAPVEEHNMIRMRPNTTLGIDKLLVPEADPTSISDAELDLKKGRILASIRKVSPSSEYFIKIPNGVAAVRGTQLELSSDGTGSSAQVVSGTVWISYTITDANGNPVSGPDGKPFPPVQVTLNPGQSIDFTQNLLNSLSQQINQAGASTTPATVTQADLQNLTSLLLGTVTSSIVTISGDQLAQLFAILAPLDTIDITITAPGSGVVPLDTGAPIFISTQ